MNKPARRLAESVLALRSPPTQAELDALTDLAREVQGPRRQRKNLAPGRMKPTSEDYRAQTAQLRQQVAALAEYRCERCSCPVPFALGHMHHTLGGSGRRRQEQSADNCAWLCGGCHDHLHRHPVEAREFRELIAERRARSARGEETTR